MTSDTLKQNLTLAQLCCGEGCGDGSYGNYGCDVGGCGDGSCGVYGCCDGRCVGVIVLV